MNTIISKIDNNTVKILSPSQQVGKYFIASKDAGLLEISGCNSANTSSMVAEVFSITVRKSFMPSAGDICSRLSQLLKVVATSISFKLHISFARLTKDFDQSLCCAIDSASKEQATDISLIDRPCLSDFTIDIIALCFPTFALFIDIVHFSSIYNVQCA